MTTPIITVKHNFQDNAGDLLLFQGQRDHRKNETNENVDWKPGVPKSPTKTWALLRREEEIGFGSVFWGIPNEVIV